MSNIMVGNGGRGCAVTAITVALILMVSSPAILTTEAFAAPKSNKDCKDIQFRTFESASYYSRIADDTITIETSQGKYSVKIDNALDSGDELVWFKNVGAKDPRGRVLLPGGEIITITLPTDGPLFDAGTRVTLFNHKVTDCETLLGHIYVEDRDKKAFEIISIEEGDELPGTTKLTVQVPDASDVDEHFTKLNVQFPYESEVQGYYIISQRVEVS
jgi:hypothetical protein